MDKLPEITHNHEAKITFVVYSSESSAWEHEIKRRLHLDENHRPLFKKDENIFPGYSKKVLVEDSPFRFIGIGKFPPYSGYIEFDTDHHEVNVLNDKIYLAEICL